MPFGEDLHLTEIKILPAMVGKTLMELELPRRFGVMVVAIRRGSPGRIVQPLPGAPLQDGDNLVIISHEEAIPQLSKGLGNY
jgi:trk system potassium uptake protein TrkA